MSTEQHDHPARPGVAPTRGEAQQSAHTLRLALEAAAAKEYHEKAALAAQSMAADIRFSALGKSLDASVRHHLPVLLARLAHLEAQGDPLGGPPPTDGVFRDRDGHELRMGDLVEVEIGEDQLFREEAIGLGVDAAGQQVVTVAGGLGDFRAQEVKLYSRAGSAPQVPAARFVTTPPAFWSIDQAARP